MEVDLNILKKEDDIFFKRRMTLFSFNYLVHFPSKVEKDYLIYCQAQPQLQLSWSELALVSIPPAARPSVRPSTRPD